MDRPSRPRGRRSTTLRIERLLSRNADGSTELMSVLQRGDRLVVSELSRGSVGRWVFAEVERDLISERTSQGLARGQVLAAEARAARKGSLGVFTARGPAS